MDSQIGTYLQVITLDGDGAYHVAAEQQDEIIKAVESYAHMGTDSLLALRTVEGTTVYVRAELLGPINLSTPESREIETEHTAIFKRELKALRKQFASFGDGDDDE